MIRHIFIDRLRLVLAVLAVAWGTAAVGFMLAIGEGFRQHFTTALQNMGTDVLAISAGVVSIPSYSHAVGDWVRITQTDWRQLQRHVGQQARLSRVYQEWQEVAVEGAIQKVISVLAVEPYHQALQDIQLQPGGRFINPLDMQWYRQVIVLGAEIASQLFPEDKNPIGRTVQLTLGEDQKQTFQVVGVTQPKVQVTSPFWPFDDQQTWIPATTYERLQNPWQVSTVLLSPNTPVLKDKVRRVIATNRKFNLHDEAILSFFDTQEIQQKNERFFTGFQILLGIIGTITLLVAGTGIASVMFIIVKKNTREIGLRMALGATPRNVLVSYLTGALLITMVGGIVGLLLVILGTYGWQHLSWLHMVSKWIGEVKPQLSPLVLAIIIGLLVVIGVIASLLPALRAAKIEPAAALRGE